MVQRLLAEIGSPEYVKDFFSPKRYEFLAARSRGHSLPVINGFEQAGGATFRSQVVQHTLAPERAEFVVDATASYPPEAGCEKFVRTLQFDKVAGKLRVQDVFALSKPQSLEGALISLYPIVLAKGEGTIRVGDLELVLRAIEGSRFVRVETHPYNDHAGKEVYAYRLVYQAESLLPKTALTIEIELA